MKQITLYVTEVPIPVNNDFHLLWSFRCGKPVADPFVIFPYLKRSHTTLDVFAQPLSTLSLPARLSLMTPNERCHKLRLSIRNSLGRCVSSVCL